MCSRCLVMKVNTCLQNMTGYQITLFSPMEFFIKFDYDMVKSGWSSVNSEGSKVEIAQDVYFSL